MKTVFVLIDQPNLDYLLVPVIEELQNSGKIKVIPCVCNSGKTELLDSKNIPYTRELHSFDEFLRSPGKKLFLNAADMNYPAHQLGWKLDELCRTNAIPSLSVEHAAHAAYGGGFSNESIVNADRIALAGSCEFDGYLSRGAQTESLVITGCPKYDLYYQLLNHKSANESKDTESSDSKKGYILVAGVNNAYALPYTGAIPEDQWVKVLKNVFEALVEKYPHLDVIVKPHPGETDHDLVRLYYEAIESKNNSSIRVIDPHASLPHLIFRSEFVLSFSPSVMLESLLLKTPVALFSHSSEQISHIRPFEEAGAITIRPVWNEISNILREELPEDIGNLQDKIELSDEFIERFVYKWDGRASGRVAYLIENMMENTPIRLNSGILVDWQDNFPVKRPLMEGVGFERYQHLMEMANEATKGQDANFSLLDVCREDESLADFVPAANYESFNPLASSHSYLSLPYENNSYDVVVASDILEHVPPAYRTTFIYALIRTARKRLVISFPSENSKDAEDMILSLFPNHKLLQEHNRYGLPSENDVENIFGALKLSYKKIPNVSLDTWIHSVLFEHVNFGQTIRGKLNLFFQENLFESVTNGKYYRNIYAVEMPIGHEKDIVLSKRSDNVFEDRQGNSERKSGAENNVNISIIVVTYNSVNDVSACLDSIRQNTKGSYEVIIVDNCSSDGTQEYLTALKDVKVFLNKENCGFSRGCNQGIRAAGGNYIVLLNPDTIVTKGWDVHLSGHFKDDVGAVGPLSNYVAGLQKVEKYVNLGLSDQIDINGIVKKLYDINSAKALETKLLIGFCMMIRRDVIEKAGMLDEDLFLGSDDLEYSLRLRNSGYRLLVAIDTFIYHKGQSSFKQEPSEKMQQLTQESQDTLYLKLEKLYGKDQVPSSYELWGMDWFRPRCGNYSSGRLTSIIILTHNQLVYTKKCIASIFEHTGLPFELIVVDNGSSDGTVSYLESVIHDKKSVTAVKVIANKANLGYAAGNNLGMAAARGDYIVLMNNDVVVTPGWLERMISFAEHRGEIGIVGPMTNCAPGVQAMNDVFYDTCCLFGLNQFAKELGEKYLKQGIRVFRASGFCLLIKRAVIEKIGGMDTRYGLGNLEDDDFGIRALLCGFQSWIAKDSFVHHFGSRTFIGAKIDYGKSLKDNWEIFKKKWNMPKALPYGPYDLTKIGKEQFDREDDYVPLKKPGSTDGNRDQVRLPSSTVMDAGNIVYQSEKPCRTIETSIVVVVSNGVKYLNDCIDSIARHTHTPYQLVFVIDSNDAKAVSKRLKTRLKADANHKVVFRPNNEKSLAKCYNRAVEESLGDNIVFIHDDVIVSAGWLEGMLGHFKTDATTGVVGPMTNNVLGVQRDACYDNSADTDFDQYTIKFRERNRHRVLSHENLAVFCIAVRRNTLEEAGLFDERFESERRLIEDLCLRVTYMGCKNIIASDVLIYHHNGIQKSNNAGEIKTIGRDRRAFEEKWRHLKLIEGINRKGAYLDVVRNACELWHKDCFADSINTLVDFVRNFPNETDAFYVVLEMLVDAKQFKEAINVINMMPSNGLDVKRFEFLGYCKEGLGQYEEAEACADEAISVNPCSALALNLKGMLAYRMGQKTEARMFFNKAIENNSGYGEPYANLGFISWEEGQADKALEYFERGFILTPTVTDILKNYHASIKTMKKYERAESIFRQACSLYPINKRLKYLFIDVLTRLGKQHDAMNEIEDVINKFGVEDGIISAALEVRKSIGPFEKIKDAGKGNSVSLCMIVKNEEPQLVRCLVNLKSIVDEIIIVDTGSSDKTKEIATLLGAKVYEYKWTNDFSEARNFSISKASGDWIFVMDADEIISPYDFDEFRKIVSRSTPKPVAYSFVTRNYNVRTDIIGLNSNAGMYEEETGVGWVPSQKVRLFTNGSGISFEYPVHEIVEPFLKRKNIEIKMTKIPVHHYGQMREDKRAFKGEEYYSIGKKKLDEMGSDDVVAIQELAVQAGMLEKWDDAANLWQMFIRHRPNAALAFVNLGTAYQNMERYADAISAATRAMKLDPNMKEAFHDYALYNLFSGNAKEAVVVLEDLVRRFSDYQSAQFKLAVAYLCLGKTENGIKLLERMKSTPIGKGLAISCHTMAEKLFDIGSYQYARAVLEGAVRGQHVNEDVFSLLNQCRKAEESAFAEPGDLIKGHEPAMHA